MIALTVDDFGDATAGKRTFPRGGREYRGFCVGLQSEHDLVDLIVEGETYRLRPGVVLPVRTSGLVKVEAVRLFDGYRAQVYGFECRDELAAAAGIKRAAYVVRNAAYTTTTGFVDSLAIPFAGRRHLAFTIKNPAGEAVTYRVLGRIYTGVGGSPFHEVTMLSDTVLAVSTTVGVHIGGTDSEEAVDELVIQTKSDTGGQSLELNADAFGELGE